MDKLPEKDASPTFGGKTVGTISGGLVVYVADALPEGNALKPLVIYAAPIVAIYAKEIGGVLLYEIGSYFSSLRWRWKLGRVQKDIDSWPDGTEADSIKKDVKKAYFETRAGLIKADLEDIRKISQLTQPKHTKGSNKDEPEK